MDNVDAIVPCQKDTLPNPSDISKHFKHIQELTQKAGLQPDSILSILDSNKVLPEYPFKYVGVSSGALNDVNFHYRVDGVTEKKVRPWVKCEIKEEDGKPMMVMSSSFNNLSVVSRDHVVSDIQRQMNERGYHFQPVADESQIRENSINGVYTSGNGTETGWELYLNKPLADSYKEPSLPDHPTGICRISANIEADDPNIDRKLEDYGKVLDVFYDYFMPGDTSRLPIDLLGSVEAGCISVEDQLNKQIDEITTFKERLKEADRFPRVRIRDCFNDLAKQEPGKKTISAEDTTLVYLLTGDSMLPSKMSLEQMDYIKYTVLGIADRYLQSMTSFFLEGNEPKEFSHAREQNKLPEFIKKFQNKMQHRGLDTQNEQILNAFCNLTNEMIREGPNTDILLVLLNNINDLQHQGIGPATGSLVSRMAGDNLQVNMILGIHNSDRYDATERNILLSALSPKMEDLYQELFGTGGKYQNSELILRLLSGVDAHRNKISNEIPRSLYQRHIGEFERILPYFWEGGKIIPPKPIGNPKALTLEDLNKMREHEDFKGVGPFLRLLKGQRAIESKDPDNLPAAKFFRLVSESEQKTAIKSNALTDQLIPYFHDMSEMSLRNLAEVDTRSKSMHEAHIIGRLMRVMNLRGDNAVAVKGRTMPIRYGEFVTGGHTVKYTVMENELYPLGIAEVDGKAITDAQKLTELLGYPEVFYHASKEGD